MMTKHLGAAFYINGRAALSACHIWFGANCDTTKILIKPVISREHRA